MATACAERLPAEPETQAAAVSPKVPGQRGQPTLLPTEPCSGDDWCLIRGRQWTVKASTPSFVYAVGGPGVLLVWEDEAWATYRVPTSSALASASLVEPHEVWTTDDQGAAFRFDGATWTRDPTTRQLGNLMQSPDGTLWALSSSEAAAPGNGLDLSFGDHVVRREAEAWREPFAPLPFCYLGTVLPLSRDEVWASGMVCPTPSSAVNVVLRSRGESWEELARSEGSWPDSLSLVAGRVRHQRLGDWTGSGWQAIPSSPGPQPRPPGAPTVSGDDPRGCNQLLRLSDDRAWCGGPDHLYVWRSGAWHLTTHHPLDETQPPEAWGTMPTRVWAGANVLFAWGSGPTDVYRLRYERRISTLEHFDGQTWTPVNVEGTPWGIDGLNKDEVWLGSGSALFRREGGAFRKVASLDAPGTELRVLAPGKVVVALDRGPLLTFDGAFKTLRTPERAWGINALTSRGDTIVIGERELGRSDRRRVLQFEGGSWVELNRGSQAWSTSLLFLREKLLVGSEEWVSAKDGEPGIAVPWIRDAIGPVLWTDESSLWFTGFITAFKRPVPAGW